MAAVEEDQRSKLNAVPSCVQVCCPATAVLTLYLNPTAISPSSATSALSSMLEDAKHEARTDVVA
jgi:hypothetical protein